MTLREGTSKERGSRSAVAAMDRDHHLDETRSRDMERDGVLDGKKDPFWWWFCPEMRGVGGTNGRTGRDVPGVGSLWTPT